MPSVIQPPSSGHPADPWPRWQRIAAEALGIDVGTFAVVWQDGWTASDEYWEARHQAASRVIEHTAQDILSERRNRKQVA